MNLMNTTNLGTRLAAIIRRATGAEIDPVLACPNVNNGVLEFAASVPESILIVAALAKFHGVTATADVDASDPDDVFAVVRLTLADLTARLARMVAA
jgi:hypothetical protein